MTRLNYVYRPRLCIHGRNESACQHPDCIGPTCAYCGVPYHDSPTPPFCSYRCRCLWNAHFAKSPIRLPYKED